MDSNRVLWSLLFLAGTGIFGWFEWQDDSTSSMRWFFLTSIWSAVCGIGYSVMDWFIKK